MYPSAYHASKSVTKHQRETSKKAPNDFVARQAKKKSMWKSNHNTKDSNFCCFSFYSLEKKKKKKKLFRVIPEYVMMLYLLIL